MESDERIHSITNAGHDRTRASLFSKLISNPPWAASSKRDRGFTRKLLQMRLTVSIAVVFFSFFAYLMSILHQFSLAFGRIQLIQPCRQAGTIRSTRVG